MLAPLFEKFDREGLVINLVQSKNRLVVRPRNLMKRKHVFDSISNYLEAVGFKCASFTMDSSIEDIRTDYSTYSVGLALDSGRFNASICTKIRLNGLAINVV